MAMVAAAVAILSAQHPRTAPVPLASGYGAGAYLASEVGQTLVNTFEPSYPKQAARDGVEGEVLLEAVVGPNGKVTKAQVTRSVDPVLDREALNALTKWIFQPGSVDGQPVGIIVPISMRFYTIRDGDKVLQRQTRSVALVPSGDVFPPDVYRSPMAGLALPISTEQKQPAYTPAAMRLKIQGTVGLEIIVGNSGAVTHARVVKSLPLNAGLDLQALKAARQWVFLPCRLHDVPVACIVELTLEFSLPTDQMAARARSEAPPTSNRSIDR
jgi:TonB family protein